jgi:hypothetical protein
MHIDFCRGNLLEVSHLEVRDLINQLNLWSQIFLKKLIVTQPVKFPAFMEPEGLLPYSKQPTSGTYRELDESNPQFFNLCFYVPF